MCYVCSDTVIGIGVEEEDRKHTWMEDANSVSKTEESSTLFSNHMPTNPQSRFCADVNCPNMYSFLSFHAQRGKIYACQLKVDNATCNFVFQTS